MRLLTAAKLIGSACVFVLLPLSVAPGCVVRLNDKNEPLVNGGVSGAPADCNAIRPEPGGVPGTDPVTKWVGRVSLTHDPRGPSLDWSGTIMNARFEGTAVTWGVIAEDNKEIVWDVVIDGAPSEEVLLPDYSADVKNPVTTKTHTLPPGVHEISVIRSSEAIGGRAIMKPFTFVGKQLPPIQRARRIEFIGDSITCGYGNEGANATCPYDVQLRPGVTVPRTQNITLAFGSLAAKMLDADAITTCFSGKGMYLNYREPDGKVISLEGKPPDPDALTTIPQYYERTFAVPLLAKEKTETEPARPKESVIPWDFTKEPGVIPWDSTNDIPPPVVFILIGQNDFGRDVNQNSITDFQEAPILGTFPDGTVAPIARFDPGTFTAEYEKFVKSVRAKRPKAHIFLAVSPMMSDKFPIDDGRTIFRNTINAIVQNLNAGGDAKVYSIELIEMGVRYGLGCDYHPNLRVHQIMAEQVAGAIRSKTCW